MDRERKIGQPAYQLVAENRIGPYLALIKAVTGRPVNPDWIPMERQDLNL